MRGGVQLRTYCANCVLVHRCIHIRLYGDVHSKSQHLDVFQETVCDRQGPPIHVGEYSRRVLSTPCSFTNLKKKGISPAYNVITMFYFCECVQSTHEESPTASGFPRQRYSSLRSNDATSHRSCLFLPSPCTPYSLTDFQARFLHTTHHERPYNRRRSNPPISRSPIHTGGI